MTTNNLERLRRVVLGMDADNIFAHRSLVAQHRQQFPELWAVIDDILAEGEK